jgi:hypothetical protein
LHRGQNLSQGIRKAGLPNVLTLKEKAANKQPLPYRETKKTFEMINKDKEIGGTHYSDMKIEPVELIHAMQLDFISGCIVKYISRYRSKGSVEDLSKALHYARMYMEDDFYGDLTESLNDIEKLAIKQYCIVNGLSEHENAIIQCACSHDYESCAMEIERLISKMEEE